MRQVNYRDPAPSRLHYRMNRLLLTPLFLRFLRIGLPLLLVLALLGAWLGQSDNRAALAGKVSELLDEFQSQPEFLVSELEFIGTDNALEEEIRQVMALELPMSSFDLDLAGKRMVVSALNRVESVEMRVRSGGLLEVNVQERLPVAVWRTRDGLQLVDRNGVFVAPLAARADRIDLPLLVGEGAPRAMDEAREILDAARPLGDDLRGLVRMGDRRWDVALEDGRRILLPADNPVAALERVLAIDAAQDIFDRDIVVVDMRNPARPTIRLGSAAAAAFRRTAGSSGLR